MADNTKTVTKYRTRTVVAEPPPKPRSGRGRQSDKLEAVQVVTAGGVGAGSKVLRTMVAESKDSALAQNALAGPFVDIAIALVTLMASGMKRKRAGLCLGGAAIGGRAIVEVLELAASEA